MFKFLKDKLKDAVSKVSTKIEEEGKEEIAELPVESPKAELKEIAQTQEPKAEEKKAAEEKPIEPEAPKHEKKGFFSAIASVFKKKEEAHHSKEAAPTEQAVDSREVATEAIHIEEVILPTKNEDPKEELQAEDIHKQFFSDIEEKPIDAEAPKEEERKDESLFEVEGAAQQPSEPEKIVEEKTSEPVAEKEEQVPKAEPEETKKVEQVEEKKEEVTPPKKKEEKKKQESKETQVSKEEKSHPKKPHVDLAFEKEPIALEESPLAEETQKEVLKEEKKEETKEEKKSEVKEEKKGFFSALKEKILTTKISESQFDDIFYELELALLESNVAVEVIEKIKQDLKGALVDQPIRRSKVEEEVLNSLKGSITSLFQTPYDVAERIKSSGKKPYIISFVGINGSGKTTSIAKMATYLKGKGLSVVLAAGDTFRAASIEQLALHGDKIGIKVIKHDYGADPAAVAFDAIKHAQAKGVDVVLIDTAGRMHQNSNLIDEMKKIIRVAKPDLKLFVGESITGNDCVEQAKSFNDAIGIDGIILSKADIDEKGGAAVSVSFVTKKPILYLGTGQEYSDLKPFDRDAIMTNLGLA